MSGKLLGAALILLGGALVCMNRSREQRREAALLGALAGVLERMETAVRWRKVSLPRLMEEMAGVGECSAFFSSVLRELKRGTTLQNAWAVGTEELPASAGKILRQVVWQGDEEHLTGQLRAAGENLRREREEQLERQRQGRALHRALVLGGAAMAVILLF